MIELLLLFFYDVLIIICLYFFVVSILKDGHVPLTFSDLDFMQSTMASPFSIHQQQLTMLGQQQSFLMAASANGSQTLPAIVPQPHSNAVLIPNQNWGSMGHQVPRMMMPVAEPQKYTQV